MNWLPPQAWPMAITYSRMVLAIPVVLCLIPQTIEFNILAVVIFVIGSISDYYDGYFARKYNAITNLGKFMDPIADKILVSSVLVMLLVIQKVDPWMVILILARDTFIGGVRSVAAADNIVIDAKPTGKWKTGLQMGAIPVLMLGWDPFGLPLMKLAYGILWITVILSLLSGAEYFQAYLKSRKS